MGDAFRVLAGSLFVFLTFLSFDGDLELKREERETVIKEEEKEEITDIPTEDEQEDEPVREPESEEEATEEEATEDNQPEEEPIKRERSDVEKIFLKALFSKAERYIGNVKTDKNGLSPFRGHFDSGQTEWSAEFIVCCIFEAEEETEMKADFLPWCDTVNDCLLWFFSRDAIKSNLTGETVLPGDYLFSDENGDGKADRVSIITEITTSIDGTLFSVIEGNPLLPAGKPRVERKLISASDASFFAVGFIG